MNDEHILTITRTFIFCNALVPYDIVILAMLIVFVLKRFFKNVFALHKNNRCKRYKRGSAPYNRKTRYPKIYAGAVVGRKTAYFALPFSFEK